MAKHYWILNRPIKDIPEDEIRDVMDGAPNSKIMRTIVMNEYQFMAATENRTLRAFWYATVKPVLTKLGRLDAVTEEETLTRWDVELSRYVAELVRAGEFTYADLRIVDTSRARDTPRDQYSVPSVESYGYQVSTGAHPEIILCTEKDTIYPILRRVSTLVGCSCISSGGQNALSATEDLLRQIPEDKRRHLLFLSVTDYDPSGHVIAETFRNQAMDCAGTLGIQTVHADRLGINPSQLTRAEITANMYKPKPKGLKRWLLETGGIDGQPYGLELDAFTPQRLREVFVQGLKSYTDEPENLPAIIAKSYVRERALRAMQPILDEVLSRVVEAQAGSVTVEPFEFWELVKDGYSDLPVTELCGRDRDESIAAATMAELRTVTESNE